MLIDVRSWPTNPAACQVVPLVSSLALQQDRVGPAKLAKMISDGTADDAATNNDNSRLPR